MNNGLYSGQYLQEQQYEFARYDAERDNAVRIPRKGFASPEQLAISVGDRVTDNARSGIVTAVSDDLVTVNVGGGYELCYWRSDLYREAK